MKKHRLAIATNGLIAYREPIFEALTIHFETIVFVTNDVSYQDPAEPELGGKLNVKQYKGFNVQFRGKRLGRLTPRFLLDLARFSPDAIITNLMGPRSIVCLLYGLIFGIPVWIWWGGTLHTEQLQQNPMRWAVRQGLFRRLGKRWISYGETSTEYLTTIGVKREHILQVQNCPDDAPYRRPSTTLDIPVPHPRVLSVGQMIPRKGLPFLLEVAADLQNDGFEFSLVLVGKGAMETEVMQLAHQLGVKQLHHIRHVPYSKMPSLYRACDLFVFPTLEDSWGLVVNEAILAGIPVISSIYAGSTKELVPPENTFDSYDRAQFREVLRNALKGQIATIDPSVVRSTREVADMMIREVNSALTTSRDD